MSSIASSKVRKSKTETLKIEKEQISRRLQDIQDDREFILSRVNEIFAEANEAAGSILNETSKKKFLKKHKDVSFKLNECWREMFEIRTRLKEENDGGEDSSTSSSESVCSLGSMASEVSAVPWESHHKHAKAESDTDTSRYLKSLKLSGSLGVARSTSGRSEAPLSVFTEVNTSAPAANHAGGSGDASNNTVTVGGSVVPVAGSGGTNEGFVDFLQTSTPKGKVPPNAVSPKQQKQQCCDASSGNCGDGEADLSEASAELRKEWAQWQKEEKLLLLDVTAPEFTCGAAVVSEDDDHLDTVRTDRTLTSLENSLGSTRASSVISVLQDQSSSQQPPASDLCADSSDDAVLPCVPADPSTPPQSPKVVVPPAKVAAEPQQPSRVLSPSPPPPLPQVDQHVESLVKVEPQQEFYLVSSQVANTVFLPTPFKSVVAYGSSVGSTTCSSADETAFNPPPSASVPAVVPKTATASVRPEPVIDSIKLQVGNTVSAMLTEIGTPGQFWVQLQNMDLSRMIEELSAHCSGPKAQDIGSELAVNKFFCAQFTVDDMWYRARVIGIHYTDTIQLNSTPKFIADRVDVRYVDYGNTETIPPNRLKRLRRKFVKHPAQAFCCSLEKVHLNRSADVEKEILEIYSQVVESREVKLTVLKVLEKAYVVKLENDEGKDVEEYIEAQLALKYPPKQPTPPPKQPTPPPKQPTPQPKQPTPPPAKPPEISPKMEKKSIVPELNVPSAKYHKDGSRSDRGDWMSRKGEEEELVMVNPRTKAYDSIRKEPKHADVPPPPVKDAENVAKAAAGRLETMSFMGDLPPNRDAQRAEFTWDCCIPPFVPKSDGFYLMVCHVNSPSSFYAHILPEASSYSELESELRDVYETQTSISSPLPSVVNLRSCWATQFSEDGKWYRVRVIKQHKEKCDSLRRKKKNDVGFTEKVTIQYVDYGNMEHTTVHRLRPLKTAHCQIPAMAVHMSLAHVYPQDITAVEMVQRCIDWHWSAEATDFLSAAVQDENGYKTLMGKPVGDGECKSDLVQPLPIILWNESSYKKATIFNKELVLAGHAMSNEYGPEDSAPEDDTNVASAPVDSAVSVSPARSEPDAARLAANELMDKWDPKAEDFMSERNSYGVDVDDAGVATTGYKANDELRICKFYARGATCYRGEMCNFEHVRGGLDGATTDQLEISPFIESALLPRVGVYVAVELTAIFNPGHFYVVLPYGPKDYVTLSQSDEVPDENEENLDTLMTALQTYYDENKFRRNTYLDYSLGENVAAYFAADGMWYRARVINSIPEDNMLMVFFCDFGNSETVSEKDVRPLEMQFRHLRFQAVECFLANVEPTVREDGFSWSPQAREWFEQEVDGKMLIAHVESMSGDVLYVNLHDTTRSEDMDLTEEMIERSFAKWVPQKSSLASPPPIVRNAVEKCPG